MEKPAVTVIMPVYNISAYVEKAIDSICSQTFTDWEMFVIDDGSTDGTGDICDMMAFADSRIRVIHQENKGAAAARNAGIEKASGKYLYFIDGDDWAAPGMLFDLVSLAEHYFLDAWAGVPVNNAGREMSAIRKSFSDPSSLEADEPEERCAQMVVAGFYIETYSSDSEYYIQKQAVRPQVFADKSEFRNKAHELFDRNLLYTPWNKLYLTSYIRENNITFPERHWDDFSFNLDVIRNIERVCVTDNAYYHFIRQRADSESEKFNITLYDEREQENIWLLELYEEWRRQAVERAVLSIADNLENADPGRKDNSNLLIPGSVGYISGSMYDDIMEAVIDDTTPADTKKPESKEQTADISEQQGETEADAAAHEVKGDPCAQADDVKNDAEADAEKVEKQPDVTKTVISVNNDVPEDEGAGTQAEAINREQLIASIREKMPEVNFPPQEAQEFIARRYIERIVGCIENVSNPESGLSKREAKQKIKEMIGKDTVRKALKTAKPKSLHMKAMLVPIRMKSSALTYMEGTFISKVKRNNARTFAKLKDNR